MQAGYCQGRQREVARSALLRYSYLCSTRRLFDNRCRLPAFAVAHAGDGKVLGDVKGKDLAETEYSSVKVDACCKI